MAQEKPVDAANDAGFPPSAPSEEPQAPVITLIDTTAPPADGTTIGSACSTAYDLVDVAEPNK
jgi:hypothetical protein